MNVFARLIKQNPIVPLAAALVFSMLAFGGCTRHKHIVVESGKAEDYYCSFYEDGTVEITSYTGSAEELKLPNRIGEYEVVGFGVKAFDGCVGLKRVYIPPTVTSLPSKLFNACPDLEAVYFSESVKTVGKNAVFECPSFKTVLFGGSAEEWEGVFIGTVPWTDNYEIVNSEIVFDYVLN